MPSWVIYWFFFGWFIFPSSLRRRQMHESRRHKNHLPPKKYGDGNLEKVWKNRSNRCFIILITDAFSELNQAILISLRRSRAGEWGEELWFAFTPATQVISFISCCQWQRVKTNSVFKNRITLSKFCFSFRNKCGQFRRSRSLQWKTPSKKPLTA